jgi:hypothetical protein
MFLSITFSFAQEYKAASIQNIHNILPMRERAKVMEEWLHWRLDNASGRY